jgi:hypothetical protein
MRLWLASSNPEAVHRLFQTGIFEGVVTNPTILAAASRPAGEVVPALCAANSGPVFVWEPSS